MGYVATKSDLHLLDSIVWNIRKYCRMLNENLEYKECHHLNLIRYNINMSKSEDPNNFGKLSKIKDNFLSFIFTLRMPTTAL